MVPRTLKALYFAALGPAMRLNAAAYRVLRSPDGGSTVKVQLGPGQRNYLEGWINVDANLLTARLDVWADIRGKLPFRDRTVDVIYSHHVIEHLPDAALRLHFREMFRCLKPGGVFRVGGPNGDAAVRRFLEGDAAWFPDFPDSRKSIGGRFANFLLCRGEHLSILTFSYLQELAQEAGFHEMLPACSGEGTNFPDRIGSDVFAVEREPKATYTLLVEAQKPIS